jgi:hypothetical protein
MKEFIQVGNFKNALDFVRDIVEDKIDIQVFRRVHHQNQRAYPG